ncbi:sensor histidine kinase [Aureimonas altamirensis]|uniref:sensor histidine kinase n=1 Tax=Aureimonas altamirensis TaxID=370622 RepID=UPI0030BA1A3B
MTMAAGGSQPGEAGVTVLYIDDDVVAGRLAQRMLSRHGISVVHAADAATGLQLLNDRDFSAVILDHDLGSGSGLDILSDMSAMENAPPAVYVTASTELSIAVDALKAGAVDYVVKTVGSEFELLLANAIRASVEKATLRRAKERAEQEVREARDRAVAMLAEVNHRVANSLALVGSLVRMQTNGTEDPAIREALTEVQARITAIANLHRSLYTSEDVRSVDLRTYLGRLVGELTLSTADEQHKMPIRFEADPVTVSPDKAVSIGVIATELMTNAIKYAYPDKKGDIRVRLAKTAEGMAELSVEDDGIGWRGEGEIQGTGLGARIIVALTRSLDSKLVYAETGAGTRAVVAFDTMQGEPKG